MKIKPTLTYPGFFKEKTMEFVDTNIDLASIESVRWLKFRSLDDPQCVLSVHFTNDLFDPPKAKPQPETIIKYKSPSTTVGTLTLEDVGKTITIIFDDDDALTGELLHARAGTGSIQRDFAGNFLISEVEITLNLNVRGNDITLEHLDPNLKVSVK